MNLTLSRLLRAGILAGGLIAVGAGVAHADETSGHHGLLSGNQVVVPIQVPITINGNAIAVLGRALATPAGHSRPASTGPSGTTPASSRHVSPTTSGRHSIGSGNQIVAPIQVPILLRGNAIGALGAAATSPATTAPTTPTDPTAPAEQSGSGPGSVLGERLSAGLGGLAGVAAGSPSLAQTGGVPLALAGVGALLVGTGALARRAGRSAPRGLKWGRSRASARRSSAHLHLTG